MRSDMPFIPHIANEMIFSLYSKQFLILYFYENFHITAQYGITN